MALTDPKERPVLLVAQVKMEGWVTMRLSWSEEPVKLGRWEAKVDTEARAVMAGTVNPRTEEAEKEGKALEVETGATRMFRLRMG